MKVLQNIFKKRPYQKAYVFEDYVTEHKNHLNFIEQSTEKWSAESAGTLSVLPLDVLLLIFSWLEAEDLRTIHSLNKQFNLLLQQEVSKALWKQLFVKESEPSPEELAELELCHICWRCKFREEVFSPSIWNADMKNSAAIVVSNNNRTATNTGGGWNTIMVGKKPVSFGKKMFTFHVDKWSSNGMMIAVTQPSWGFMNSQRDNPSYQYQLSRYPGSGYAGITVEKAKDSAGYAPSVAYYSHDGVVFKTGDTIGLEINMKKREVMFFRNGESVGQSILPGAPGEPVVVVAAFCSAGHALSVVKNQPVK